MSGADPAGFMPAGTIRAGGSNGALLTIDGVKERRKGRNAEREDAERGAERGMKMAVSIFAVCAYNSNNQYI